GLSANGLRRRAFSAAGTENEDGLSDLELVAGLEDGVMDRLAVDVDAVGAIAVEEPIAGAVEAEAELGVAARDFGLVAPACVAGVAADPHHRAGQLELPAF